MTELNIGLEGVAVAETKISCVNGEKGELIYRGYRVEDAVDNTSFEAIVYLLWRGTKPSAEALSVFSQKLVQRRRLPAYLKDLIRNVPRDLPVMTVVRTAVSALRLEGEPWPPTEDQALELVAKIPTIIAFYHRLVSQLPETEPDSRLSHVENYLYMLTAKQPKEAQVRALETYLMLSADHDMNASTFTARVVASTQSDIISSVVAAMGALIGPLHGGAPSKVDDMLDAVGTEANAEAWVRAQLEQGHKLMGFGHRVYKTYDPRATALKKIAQKFSEHDHYFKLSLCLEKVAIRLLEEYKPGRSLYPNLEFWAAGVFRSIDLPPSLYTPSFCVARVAGWSAHVMEQAQNNRLIRPSCIYVGPVPTH